MTKEEIEKRILICESKIRDYLEVGNTKIVNKYENEIHKWEKLLDQLNPKMYEELQDYKKGYFNLQSKIEKLINYLESLLTSNKTTDEFIVISVLDLLEKVRSGNYGRN